MGGPVVLLMVGVARLATHWDYYDDEPMRWLLLMTIAVGAVAVGHLIEHRYFPDRYFPDRLPPTALGRSLLERWRKEDPDTSETKEERLALAVALGDEAASAVTAPDARTLAAKHHEPRDPTGALLIAEDLLLLGMARSGNGPGSELSPQLAGAILTELMLRERVAIRAQSNAGQPTVTVVDRAATGDDLLDEALALLTTNATPVASPSLSDRVFGWAARRRLRSRRVVSPRDVVSWWRKHWRLAEFPDLVS